MVETLHFSITGDGATRVARDSWEERNCIHAFKVTEDGYGMNKKQSLDLLEGRMKLVGDTRKDPNLYAEEDTHKGITLSKMIRYYENKYLEERVGCIDLYIKLKSKAVIYLEMADFQSMMNEHALGKSIALKYEIEMNESLEQIVFLYSLKKKNLNLFFKKVYKRLKDLEQLEEKGSNRDEYLEKKFSKKPEVPKLKVPEINVPQEEDIIIIGKIGDSRNGWISPKGIFYLCDAYGHRDLTDALNSFNVVHGSDDEIAMDKGWLKLSGGSFVSYRRKGLSKRQKDFMFDYSLHYELAKLSLNGIQLKISEIYDIDAGSYKW